MTKDDPHHSSGDEGPKASGSPEGHDSKVPQEGTEPLEAVNKEPTISGDLEGDSGAKTGSDDAATPQQGSSASIPFGIEQIIHSELRPGQAGYVGPTTGILSYAKKFVASPCPVPPVIDDFLGMVEALKVKRVLIVRGDDTPSLSWAADSLSKHVDFRDVRRAHSRDLQEDFPNLFNNLVTRNGATCLVLECPFDWLENCVGRLGSALANASRRHSFGLIICTTSGRPFRQEMGGNFPENVTLVHVRSTTASGPEGNSSVLADDHYAKIFRPSHEDLADLLAAADARFIERTLVRIAVLFGPLPVQDFEMVARVALRAKTLKVRTKGGGGNESTGIWTEIAAVELWRSAKEHFLAQAGLIQCVDTSPQQIAFAGEQQLKLAGDEAWRDPDAMIDVFLRSSELEVLFDERAKSERKELFDAYVAAAVSVSRHSPKVFGNRWMEAMLVDYAGWVASRTSTPKAPEGADLLAFLSHIADSVKTDQERERLWNHFCDRVGYLCQCLAADERTVDIVGDFLERLVTRGRWELAWNLIGRLQITGKFPLTTWGRRVLRESKLGMWKTVVRALGRESVVSGESMASILGEGLKWLDEKDEGVEYVRLKAGALAIPVAAVEALLGAEDGRDGGGRLPDLLGCGMVVSRLDSGGGLTSVAEAWRRIYAHPDFGHAAAKFLFNGNSLVERPVDIDQGAAALAISLVKMVDSCQVDARDAGYSLASSVFGELRPEVRSGAKRQLLEFAERIAEKRNQLSFKEEDLAHREMLYGIFEICKELASL